MARHYEVPLWSDKHFELIGKSLALMAEVRLAPGVRQPGGRLLRDRLQPRVARPVDQAAGRRLQARLHRLRQVPGHGRQVRRQAAAAAAELLAGCQAGKARRWADGVRARPGDGQDRAHASQPRSGTAEAVAFWRPVFDEMLKKLQARGWLDATTLGCNIRSGRADQANVAKLAQKLWPDGVWATVTHNVDRGTGETGNNPWVRSATPAPCATTVIPSVRGYRELLKPQPGFFCNAYRGCWQRRTRR